MRKQRAENGWGTVVCLDKTGTKRRKPWAVRVTIGWVDGKQQTKYIGYYEKEKEAQRALLEYNSKGMSYNANTVTFEQVYEMWREKNEGKMTPKNLGSYNAAYNLVPQLHKKKMKDIKSRQLQMAMDDIKLKYSSKTRVKSLIKQMYQLAILDDLVMKDYSMMLDIKCKQEESGTVYTHEEIQNLWDIREQNPLVDDILILIYTGMRISEALSIQPTEHFHLEDGYFECHGTKNQSSDRLVPIHPSILPILEERKNRNWLFLNSYGKKSQYRTFAYAYEKFLREIGFDHIIHDTRKTFATILHENDVMESDIKAILGHAQSNVTQKVYVKHRIERLVEKIKTVKFV